MRLLQRSASAAAAAALFFTTPALAQKTAAPPPGFDAYVARTLKEFDVPGAAVAIVKDGRVVLAKGYGVQTLGQPTPVDAHTRFGIASNTKAFTGAALAMLVEEGKLQWDAPVIRYLPAFAMYDPYVTRELTVRDLLVHRSGLGLGAGDLLWWPSSAYSRDEAVRRLRYLPPATSFRSTYAYDNVLYMVAGELVRAVTGQTWEEYVAARILSPLAMNETAIGYRAAEQGGNLATPHAEVEGVVRPVPPYTGENANPAAGLHSNVSDMAKWMIVQLDSGRVAGRERIFSPRSTREMWSIVTPIPIGTPAPELSHLRLTFNGYGLGFVINDYRGHKRVTHTGGLPGYLSQLTLIPELNLGVVVLTNQESGAAFNSITNRVLDHYLGQRPFDYPSAYSTILKRQNAQVDSVVRAANAERDSASGPSLPLERYAGRYRDQWYGDVVIAPENGRLMIRFEPTPELAGELVHWKQDAFVARWTDRSLRADAYVIFSLNPDGSIESVHMLPFSPAVDFSFDFEDLLLRPVR
jgi:CubicO group peptidase (beta-lactamase class C family)